MFRFRQTDQLAEKIKKRFDMDGDINTSKEIPKSDTFEEECLRQVDVDYEGSGTVYVSGNEVYSCELTMGSHRMDQVKYYIIQIIDIGNGFDAFNAWGKVGRRFHKTIRFENVADAIKDFTKKFTDKTGNEWCDRHNFVPKESKYVLTRF